MLVAEPLNATLPLVVAIVDVLVQAPKELLFEELEIGVIEIFPEVDVTDAP